MQIGFIGLGSMGRGIAMNLLSHEQELIVFDTSQAACEPLVRAGARLADSPKHLAACSDVVFTSLPTPAIVESVCWSEDGLAAGLSPGSTWFDLSTNSVHVVRRLHEQLAGADVSFLDAPVSGGPIGAAKGRLAVWVGGSAERFAEFSPVLDVVGDQSRYVGPIGAGTISKLVHNMASTAIKAVLAEALTMGVKAGLDPLALWSAIREGAAGRSRSFDNITRFLEGNLESPSFRLELLRKDVDLALQMGHDAGVPMRLCRLVGEDVTEALNLGWADWDSQSVMELQRRRAGVADFAMTKEQIAAVLAAE
jgi:3-hydroxyisobutyrate dehydrogenase